MSTVIAAENQIIGFAELDYPLGAIATVSMAYEKIWPTKPKLSKLWPMECECSVN